MTRDRVAAIGEPVAVQGFGLVGVLVLTAGEPDEVRAAWQRLPADVAFVILTPAAAATIPAGQPGELPLRVVIPG